MNYPPPPPPPPFDTAQSSANVTGQPMTVGRINFAPPPCVGPNPGRQLPPPTYPPPQAAVVAQPKRTINVRNKGQRGERQVVQLLQAIVDKVRRDKGVSPAVLQRNALQAHLGGDDLHGLDGFSVEVKWQEIDYNPAWWRQCLRQAEERKAVPILFYRSSRMKWRIKFRAYVSTPFDRDQIEMDLETNEDDFVEWFGNAYAEEIDRQLGRL